MLRQVSSRNQRSKGGFRVKHAIQLCTLVGVSVWLLYQINHSHYKKKVYEGIEAQSSEFSEDQHEITRLGRKDLPTEDAEDVEQAMHNEGINRDGGDLKLDGLARERAAEQASAHGKERNAESKWQTNELEEQEREENSHEAREKTFTGDDASSEVVHNSLAQEGEHDERSHEAQEKSFKADDASSAVDHVTELKQSELESESEGIRDLNEKPLDSTEKKNKENEIDEDDVLEYSEGSDSSVKEKIDASNSSVSEVAVAKLTEVSHSSTLVNGSDRGIEHQTDWNVSYTYKNHTEAQTYPTNDLDSHIQESKDQIDPKTNSSSVDHLTIIVDPTINVTAENQFNTSSVLQDQNNGYNSEKIEEKENPDTVNDKDQENEVIDQVKQETGAIMLKKPEENSQGSSAEEEEDETRVSGGENVASEEERREDDVVSSLPDIQDKAKINEEQAGEYDQEV